MSRALRATAYHEAGHAVMSYNLNVAFVRVTIRPDGDALGSILSRIPAWVNPELNTNARTSDWIERRILISFAGAEAERMVSSRPKRVGSLSDREWAAELASYRCGGQAETSAYLKWLSIKTNAAMNTPRIRVAVDALAEALLERHTLRAPEVRSIIRQAIQAAAARHGRAVEAEGEKGPAT